MSKKSLFIITLVAVLGVLAILVWIFFKVPKIIVGSENSQYKLTLNNKPDLEKFLDKTGFWQWQNEFTQNRKISRLSIVYTDKPQLFNKETVKKDSDTIDIGSVGTRFNNGELTLLIQSNPVIWGEENKNWHVEAQLLRFINGHAENQYKIDEITLFTTYKNDIPPFFELNEK